MKALNTLIENQYHTPGLFEDILNRLAEQEINMDNVSRHDIANMDDILERLCFKNLVLTDQTYKGKLFLQDLFEKLKANGPPKLGLNVLMGSSTREKLEYILKGLEEEQIVLQSGIYKKRAIN